MLDIFIGEPLTARTLRQSHPFAERAVIGFAVGRVQMGNRVGAFDTYRHFVKTCS